VAHTASTEPAESTRAPRSAGEHESPLHESSNIRLRALVNFVVIFVVAAVVIHLIIYGIFAGFRSAVGQPREITGVSADHIPNPPLGRQGDERSARWIARFKDKEVA